MRPSEVQPSPVATGAASDSTVPPVSGSGAGSDSEASISSRSSTRSSRSGPPTASGTSLPKTTFTFSAAPLFDEDADASASP